MLSYQLQTGANQPCDPSLILVTFKLENSIFHLTQILQINNCHHCIEINRTTSPLSIPILTMNNPESISERSKFI